MEKQREQWNSRVIIWECPKCKYSWEYGGKSIIARCPKCRKSINLKKYFNIK